METAQDTFRRLCRDFLGPAFREMGLRGSRSNYVLPDDRYWMGIAVERHKWSDASRVFLTLDMNIVSKADWSTLRADPVWAGFLPERPSITAAWPVGLTWRVGTVLEPGETWWELRAGQPLDDLAAELVRIVRDGMLPWLRSHVDDPNYYSSEEARTRFHLLQTRLGRFITDFDIT